MDLHKFLKPWEITCAFLYTRKPHDLHLNQPRGSRPPSLSMPTPIDRAVSQRVSAQSIPWNYFIIVRCLLRWNRCVLTSRKGPFFAFAAVITGVAAWSIWGQDLFPSRDPTGGMHHRMITKRIGADQMCRPGHLDS